MNGSAPRSSFTSMRSESSGRRPAPALGRSERLDEILRASVERTLQATGHYPLQRLQVRVEGSRVKLGGKLPSYYLLQVAQSMAGQVPGITAVTTDVEVSSVR